MRRVCHGIARSLSNQTGGRITTDADDDMILGANMTVGSMEVEISCHEIDEPSDTITEFRLTLRLEKEWDSRSFPKDAGGIRHAAAYLRKWQSDPSYRKQRNAS